MPFRNKLSMAFLIFRGPKCG